MNVGADISSDSVKPQDIVLGLMGRAFESRQSGNVIETAATLEAALAAARKTPFEIEFQTRIQLATSLADAYLDLGEVEKAR